jgi:site-specific DNA recombinase
MAVAIYLRVSTEEQRERQSIATQRDFAGRYCGLHELSVFETFADDGVTGTVPLGSRPAGKRLLDAARRNKFDQVLVYKLDRLGRETRLTLDAVAELEKCGVRVRSMTEEFDSQTPTGRLMMTMLSGFAAHEREVIRERSSAGTNRKAEAGVWLGGVVPYGYRKVGEKGQARLVVAEEPIPGLSLSEAEVVRTIYRMSATERQSCQKIADYLNQKAIPCNSSQNWPKPEAGKRGRKIAPIWRPSHVRNMIVSRTYMGEHIFGKRSANKNRKLIPRPVPAIVSEEMWQSAQEVLRSHRIMCKRNRKHPYLLRGLIKCGLCGLTFSGYTMCPPQNDHYYRCNGRQFARGLYGNLGKKCPAKSLNGDYVDRIVWADIETFLRNPGDLLLRLRERLAVGEADRQQRQQELAELTKRLEQKTEERERIVGLFRRGRIDESALDKELDLIDGEARALQAEIDEVSKALDAGERESQFRSAESLLAALRKRLDRPVSPEMKRKIVEALVEVVQANTIERWGVQETELTIRYRFSEPTEPAPLILPRSHRLSTRNRMPEKLETIGDHLLRRRLALKLLQRQVAEIVGVDKASIYNWERNYSEPRLEYMPAIIRFLGYNPFPPSKSWAERLVHGRKAIGLSQREAAARIGVDMSTLARWERGEREPTGRFAACTEALLRAVETRRTLLNAKLA